MKSLISSLFVFLTGCSTQVPQPSIPVASPVAAGELSVADIVASQVAKKIYGAAAIQTAVASRRGLLVTFERQNGWGELRFLLVQMPEPQNMRIVSLQDAAGNYPNQQPTPKAEVELLFADRTFKGLKQYGRVWSADVFESPTDRNPEINREIIPVIARRCLIDGSSMGREKEWKTAYFRIEPLMLSEHSFETNRPTGPGANVISCSVFVDHAGVAICHAPGLVITVD
jgi:hypothetical protein